MTTPRIPVAVVAGYLGSGKTTLINRLLGAATEPIAIVVNDFGSVNIDAALIKERHVDTIELTNGCVCCVVGGSLADVLMDIDTRPTRPAAVIIEASGVADPATVASYAHLGGFRLAGTVVLVDAVNASATNSDKLVQSTFRRQLRCADLIVVTKTDLASDQDMSALHALLAEHAEGTPAIGADSLEVQDLFDIATPSTTPLTDDPHGRFSSVVIDIPSDSERADLLEILGSLPAGTVRAKGIVALTDGTNVLVQRVGRHTSVTPTDLDPTGIVAIIID